MAYCQLGLLAGLTATLSDARASARVTHGVGDLLGAAPRVLDDAIRTGTVRSRTIRSMSRLRSGRGREIGGLGTWRAVDDLVDFVAHRLRPDVGLAVARAGDAGDARRGEERFDLSVVQHSQLAGEQLASFLRDVPVAKGGVIVRKLAHGDRAALAVLPDSELLPLSKTAVVQTKRVAEIVNQREGPRTGVRRVAVGHTHQPLIGRLSVRMRDQQRHEPQRVAFGPVRPARLVDPIQFLPAPARAVGRDNLPSLEMALDSGPFEIGVPIVGQEALRSLPQIQPIQQPRGVIGGAKTAETAQMAHQIHAISAEAQSREETARRQLALNLGRGAIFHPDDLAVGKDAVELRRRAFGWPIEIKTAYEVAGEIAVRIAGIRRQIRGRRVGRRRPDARLPQRKFAHRGGARVVHGPASLLPRVGKRRLQCLVAEWQQPRSSGSRNSDARADGDPQPADHPRIQAIPAPSQPSASREWLNEPTRSVSPILSTN